MKGLKLDEHPTIRNLMSKNIYDVRIRESITTVYLLSDIMVISEPVNVKNSITLYNLYHGELLLNSNEKENEFTLILENNQRFIFSTESREEKQIWISKFNEILDFLNTDDTITSQSQKEGEGEGDDEEEDYDTLSIDDQTLVLFNNDGKSIEATKGSDRLKIESIFKKAKKKIQHTKTSSSSDQSNNIIGSKLNSPIPSSSSIGSIENKSKFKLFSSEAIDSDTELPDLLKKKFGDEISISDLKSIEDGKDFSFLIQFKVRKIII